MEGNKTSRGDGNLFNTLRGEHFGKEDDGMKENCTPQQQEEVVEIEETSKKNNGGGKENIGEVEQVVISEETINALREREAANDVLKSEVNNDTQKFVGNDQDNSAKRVLVCDLNKQVSSIGDSFSVDHNFSPVRGVMNVVDDDKGLTQRIEPPDKGYCSNKGSTLSVNNSKQTLGEYDNESVEPDTNSLEVYS
ncbi:unnamed protein product [Ilex paraguariensis]|uniref:Uncharacterized protein n=1 Tax=Ilex paraguariensis TaxID=185542 RepID=A0ABC8UZB8_9AQUA